MKKLLIIAAFAAICLPTLAAPPPYYVAGDFNGWNAAGNLLTETSPGSGIWRVDLTGISAGRHEFKFTVGDWSWNYPGPNSWLYAPASGNISITYDLNTYSDGWRGETQRIGVSYDPGTWTVAGNFQGWNNANPATAMASMGGGIYQYQTVMAPGDYLWKPVVTGTWDSISWDTRSVGTSDYAFTVVPGAELVTFWVNGLAGTVRMDMQPVPEPSVLALFGCAAGGLLWFRRRS